MFCSVVCAYTWVGELTAAPSDGVDTQMDPADVEPGLGAGIGAGPGKGATPVCGPALICTATVGQEIAGLDGGGGVVTPPVEDIPPQPVKNKEIRRTTERA